MYVRVRLNGEMLVVFFFIYTGENMGEKREKFQIPLHSLPACIFVFIYLFCLHVVQLGFDGCVENARNANWVDPTSSAGPADQPQHARRNKSVKIGP